MSPDITNIESSQIDNVYYAIRKHNGEKLMLQNDETYILTSDTQV